MRRDCGRDVLDQLAQEEVCDHLHCSWQINLIFSLFHQNLLRHMKMSLMKCHRPLRLRSSSQMIALPRKKRAHNHHVQRRHLL